jgi:hypothetical protein
MLDPNLMMAAALKGAILTSVAIVREVREKKRGSRSTTDAGVSTK